MASDLGQRARALAEEASAVFASQQSKQQKLDLAKELLAAAKALEAASNAVLDQYDCKAMLESGTYWSDWNSLRPFLLACIPHLAVSSPLRVLPHELVRHIAQLAHRPRLGLQFEQLAPGSGWFLANDATTAHLVRTHSLRPFPAAMPRLRVPCGAGFQYLEIDLMPHFGSIVHIGDSEFHFAVPDHGPKELLCVYHADLGESALHISAFEGFHHSSPNTLELLIDRDAGAVRLGLNGVAGPELQLGDFGRDGLEIRMDGEWPETVWDYLPDGSAKERQLRTTSDDGRESCGNCVTVRTPRAVPAHLCVRDLSHDHGLCSGCELCEDLDLFA